MKTLKRIWLVITFLGLSYIFLSGVLSLNNFNSGMEDFILGRWVNKSHGTYGDGDNSITVYTYQLEFLKSGKVIFNRTGGNYPLYNLQMDYQLLGENKVVIKGRYIDTLNIGRDGQDLLIEPDSFLAGGGRFYRAPTIAWSIIALLFSFALIYFGFFYLPGFIQETKKLRFAFSPKLMFWKKVVGIIVYGSICAILFYVGWMVAVRLWGSGFLAEVMLPWDAILSFELGLGILFLIIFLIPYGFRKSQKQSVFIRLGGILFAVFLLGSSLLWIFFGLFKFTVFIVFGKYPG